ncbi:hypothetical protein BV898_13632 [Hypsibius exemplaris]|uniref:Uncharacterized protein n=1 Tax=Hypsibius exemplaris TaxID=2072580 RepID=A0A1W0WA77_HYPEX|nr:hypothetical protein BV898_13632 [Hypsibius exemplaris]
MRDILTPNSHCFGCINVRYVTLALAIGYLVVHVLGMSLLVHLSVCRDALAAAMKPNVTVGNMVAQIYITNLYITRPSSAAGVPSVNELSLALVCCALNAFVAMLAILGISKDSPGCLVPFFLSQATDFILSVMGPVGLDLKGLTAKEDILAGSGGIEGDSFEELQWKQKAVVVTGRIRRLVIKLCLLLAVYKCIKHVQDENVRIAHEER